MRPDTPRRRQTTIAGLLLTITLLLGHSASAVPITASVQLTNGSLGSINLTDTDTSLNAPVQAQASTTVSGNPTGVLLGSGAASGTTGGLFSVGVSGQETHAHTASFQFTETIQNTTAMAQVIKMDFLIDAGQLSTIVREDPIAAGGFLEAGYEIVISFEGSVVFQSSALLRQVSAGMSTSASVTQSGTSLGGMLTHVQLFPDEYLFDWNAFSGTLGLGVLNAGASGVLQYDVRAFVAAEGNRDGGTLASIGDPLKVSGNPNGTPFAFAFQPVTVPEPASWFLLGSGLLGFVMRSKIKRRAVDRGQ